MHNEYIIFTCFEYRSISVSKNVFFAYIEDLKKDFKLADIFHSDNLNSDSYYFYDKDGYSILVGCVYFNCM